MDPKIKRAVAGAISNAVYDWKEAGDGRFNYVIADMTGLATSYVWAIVNGERSCNSSTLYALWEAGIIPSVDKMFEEVKNGESGVGER